MDSHRLRVVTTFSLAASFDGLLHLYRLVELDHLIAEGVWFPRWAPDFVYGFGYPIFNYYAPLSYYLSLPLHWEDEVVFLDRRSSAAKLPFLAQAHAIDHCTNLLAGIEPD